MQWIRPVSGFSALLPSVSLYLKGSGRLLVQDLSQISNEPGIVDLAEPFGVLLEFRKRFLQLRGCPVQIAFPEVVHPNGSLD
jgi:hypothetical protein